MNYTSITNSPGQIGQIIKKLKINSILEGGSTGDQAETLKSQKDLQVILQINIFTR
jgi:hypothetical protein